MRTNIVLIVSALAAAVLADEEGFSSRLEKLDVDEVLSNERLLNKYVSCLLDEADSICTAEGKEIKRALPSSLADDCSKCSVKQREAVDKIIKYLIHNKRNVYDKLTAKYDPDGVYTKKYEKRIHEYES